MAAAYDGAQQLANLLKFDVIIELFDILSLAKLAHLSTSGLLKKGLKHVFDKGTSILKYDLYAVDVAKEDGGKHISHGTSCAHIGLLFRCVRHPVIDGIAALVASEQLSRQDANLTHDKRLKLDGFGVILNSELFYVYKNAPNLSQNKIFKD